MSEFLKVYINESEYNCIGLDTIELRKDNTVNMDGNCLKYVNDGLTGLCLILDGFHLFDKKTEYTVVFKKNNKEYKLSNLLFYKEEVTYGRIFQKTTLVLSYSDTTQIQMKSGDL